MRSAARRLRADANIGLVVVDYLQLIQSTSDAENRTQEISQISRSLKALAKELAVPVVALSQLSRATEQRTDKRPQRVLSPLNLRDLADADLVFHYPEMRGPTDKRNSLRAGPGDRRQAAQWATGS